MGAPRPFLQTACICENVLLEADNIPSIIRIVGKFTVTPPPNLPADAQMGFPVTFFVSLKGGEFTGRGTVTLYATRPDGSEGQKNKNDADMVGPTTTVQIKSSFHILSPQSGIYWFHVLWNDEILTKIPLEVEITKPSLPTPVTSTVAPSKPT